MRTHIQRILFGLTTIWPGVVRGALAGSIAALVLPSASSLVSLALQELPDFSTTNLGKSLDPWLKATTTPKHFTLIVLAIAVALTVIALQTLWQFLRRLSNWVTYEPTFLWSVALLAAWRYSILWASIALGGTASLTCAMAWIRNARQGRREGLINPDQSYIATLKTDSIDKRSSSPSYAALSMTKHR